MTIDHQLLDFMPHTVTISPFSSFNNYGEVQIGTTRTASAYVVPGNTLDSGMTVRESHKGTTIYIADTSIGISDKITMPDGTTQQVASVEKHTEVIGLEHSVVTVL